ncbi:MAG TPA: squalene/phytoene synthase family protein [Chloroflexota bacterium]|nr:squalene/phytoene synthase family protein [Chloroflexota bacterium]
MKPSAGRVGLPHPSAGVRFRLSADERYCLDVTKREAGNFYWGFVTLPREQRLAIYALYSFSREVDDSVDLNNQGLNGGGEARRAACRVAAAEQKSRIEACYAGNPTDPVMSVLCEVVRRYEIPMEEMQALVTGVEMDIDNSHYQRWSDLEVYCRHVASAVGRMCTRIFGFSDVAALDHADDLGVALQLTNILRDVREDYDLGRVYLPQEDLARFALGEDDLLKAIPGADWESLVEFEVARARTYFSSGMRVTEYIPRRSGVCVRTMAGIYRNILDRIADEPCLPLRQRTSLRKRTKIKVLLQSWLQAM